MKSNKINYNINEINYNIILKFLKSNYNINKINYNINEIQLIQL